MKTFKQFMTEASMPDELAGGASVRQSGEGGRVDRKRKKSEAKTRRMKAVGGGKMAPVTYKDRKDIGTQKKRETREQQPTQARGSAADAQKAAAKAERKRAAQARIAARKSGGEVKKDTTSSRDKEKTATKLLSTKKEKKPVNPNYKPAKPSGKTRAERDKIKNQANKYLKSVFKDQETAKYKKETGQNPDAKGRTKILGRVNKRMST